MSAFVGADRIGPAPKAEPSPKAPEKAPVEEPKPRRTRAKAKKEQ